ncbi:DUF397 domain-containing protein [Gandjariella thermophila]|uniref:DUF397 domain-containing protein n=1 Tax=Gandjariella thermophila TaxID=1931992 RepID=A0A4D4J8H6_9PSEU|nr:DUF397 domain-containing protein [Gandjariella thermophila]GDY31824.1 hypothetical protein GTS_34570 [Gandjariella thermophila]
MNTPAHTAQAPTAWRKSSYSTGTGNCVEVAPAAGGVVIRHSKHPTAGTITFGFADWKSFIHEVQNGPNSTNSAVTVTRSGTDTLVRSLHTGVELRFDQAEWSAFVAGAIDGEFDLADRLTTTVN